MKKCFRSLVYVCPVGFWKGFISAVVFVGGKRWATTTFDRWMTKELQITVVEITSVITMVTALSHCCPIMWFFSGFEALTLKILVFFCLFLTFWIFLHRQNVLLFMPLCSRWSGLNSTNCSQCNSSIMWLMFLETLHTDATKTLVAFLLHAVTFHGKQHCSFTLEGSNSLVFFLKSNYSVCITAAKTYNHPTDAHFDRFSCCQVKTQMTCRHSPCITWTFGLSTDPSAWTHLDSITCYLLSLLSCLY